MRREKRIEVMNGVAENTGKKVIDCPRCNNIFIRSDQRNCCPVCDENFPGSGSDERHVCVSECGKNREGEWMSIELSEAIEKLRPVAEFREMCLSSGRYSARERRQARADTETLMIRRLKEVGVLPAFLIPIIWKIIYSIAWAAIKYWVQKIHETEGAQA